MRGVPPMTAGDGSIDGARPQRRAGEDRQARPARPAPRTAAASRTAPHRPAAPRRSSRARRRRSRSPKLQPSAKAARQSALPSSSQTRPAKDTISTGARSNGGSATAASAPSRIAASMAPPAGEPGGGRAPCAAAASAARRCGSRAGSELRAHSWAASPGGKPRTRNRLTRRGSASSTSNSRPEGCLITSPRAGTRPASAKTSPPRVSTSSWSGGNSGTLRARLERLDRRARVGDHGAVAALDQLRLVGVVVLVLDLADDLLDHVLDGDEPVDAAELVDHQRHVHAREPHLQQQVEHRHATAPRTAPCAPGRPAAPRGHRPHKAAGP